MVIKKAEKSTKKQVSFLKTGRCQLDRKPRIRKKSSNIFKKII